jgi:CTP:molybdopterin cytidylyltransferase MocA
MVQYVVEALREARTVEETFIVAGPGERLPAAAVASAEQVRAAGESFADTIAAAARHVGQGLLVVATADLPLLTAAAVDDAAQAALDSGADLTYTVAEVGSVLAAFPGNRRTSVRLREGRFTGGNLVVASASALLHSVETIQAAFGRRKSVVGLALLLGPMFIARLALGLLTFEGVAARAAQLLDCRVAVHVTPYPEIAFDVDKPSDLQAAKAALAARWG